LNIWRPGKLDPIKQAFIECGAFQCGCTPGFVMTKALIGRIPTLTTNKFRISFRKSMPRAAYPEIVTVKMARTC
jgi:carbon-monoxide dehydrogenase small subunit